MAIWKSRYQHLSIKIGIGISIGTAKILFLPFEFFFVFWIKQNIQYTSIFFLMLNYSYSPIQRRPHWCFEKQLLRNFWKIPNKTSIVESFSSMFVGLSENFPKSCLERLFCRRPVAPASVKRTPQPTLHQEFFKSLKILKSEGSSLYVFNLLKRNSISELFKEIFKNFPKDL